MNRPRIGITVTGTAAVVSILLAGSTVWLLLTSPVTVARALNEGSVTPMVRQIATVLVEALRGLLAYL